MSHLKLEISPQHRSKATTEALIKCILADLPLVLLMVDKNAQLLFSNKEALNSFGGDFFTSLKITQLFQQFNEYDFNHTIKQLNNSIVANKKETVKFSISFFHQQKTYTANLSISHYPLDEHNDTLYLISIVDIQSENKDNFLKKNFKELKQFARLSAMREISSSLADKLNQPLTAILSYTQAMQRLYKINATPDEINNAMERVVINAENAGRIIKQVRAKLNVNTLNYQSTCINTLIQESIYLTELGNPASNIQLSSHFEQQNTLLYFDPLQMRQVIFSLLNNAIDAVMERPNQVAKIMLKTQLKTPDIGTYFEIIIADNGPGLPEEIQANLFEPFMTTKKNGIGIGLSMCHHIIGLHKGSIHISSEPSDTSHSAELLTTVRICLPLEPEQIINCD